MLLALAMFDKLCHLTILFLKHKFPNKNKLIFTSVGKFDSVTRNMVLYQNMLSTENERGHVSSLINRSEAIAIQTAFLSRSMRYDKRAMMVARRANIEDVPWGWGSPDQHWLLERESQCKTEVEDSIEKRQKVNEGSWGYEVLGYMNIVWTTSIGLQGDKKGEGSAEAGIGLNGGCGGSLKSNNWRSLQLWR